jgi:ABC-type phosphate transport system permease subunit
MTTSSGNSIGKWLVNSMWVFWLVLLAASLGIAAGIYLIWLKGNI